MGSEYRFGINPFQDFLMESLMYEVDISDKQFISEITSSFKIILGEMLENPKEVLFLEFDIKNIDGHYKLIGKNSVSALWLSGIIVDDASLIMRNDKFKLGNKLFTYDKKTNELSYIIVDE